MKWNKKDYEFYYKKMDMNIAYFSPWTMKMRQKVRNLDGEYTVAGEINVKDDGKETTRVKNLQVNGKEIAVQPLGTYEESQYQTLGYIPCEGGEYIVVKRKRHSKYLLLLPMLLVLLIAGGLFYIYRAKLPDVDPSAKKCDMALKRPDNIDASKVLIPGYGKFTIDKGSNTIDTVLFNPAGNPCYFQFTLVEKDTGDVLYKSKLVPPGEGIAPVKMNKTFEQEGTYKAILKFRTSDLKNPKIHYNSSDSDVNLIVVK